MLESRPPRSTGQPGLGLDFFVKPEHPRHLRKRGKSGGQGRTQVTPGLGGVGIQLFLPSTGIRDGLVAVSLMVGHVVGSDVCAHGRDKVK